MRHFDTHVEKRSCKPSERGGPWCATTVKGIQRVARERLEARTGSVELVNASNAITPCLLHTRFARDHIQYDWVLTSPGVLAPTLDLFAAITTDALEKANNMSRILRVAAMDVVMLFISLPRLLPP